ncbi:rhodanese-like protein [Catenovulum agarivorans DS-2]|uniref:Rhodanese-like protein n=1 Tax=Catenovulum agarivorans DS-2 TaxID=1328313 RepID=W7QRJ5_9ALTE|nr:TonB-dependent receptor [Catenovulum agarivorans]EWH10498.1 rhodanese-like protein [Catenovulum agarivorans DS-2]
MIKKVNLCTFKLNQIAVAFGTVGLLSISSSALAQTAQEEDTEVIAVTGVRSSLEAALNTKREAVSIVDAISASDIDALPALDLGEALQALPGVQLNSGDEGRQSTISLRGLGSGFVKTTAFGQSFAVPSAAGGPDKVGAANPFSSFEAGVFDGVTVVKSPTADLQEGGMAGIVDKKLQRALAKKDGTAGFSIGAIYEELADAVSPEIKLYGVKHLIEDKLAVAFKFSASEQEFRRDTFDVIDYVNVEDQIIDITKTVDGQKVKVPTLYTRATNLAEYKTKWADVLGDNAEIRVPHRGRNVTQYSDGNRASFSGNIELKATDNLKVGAHILASQRKLDNGTKETTNYELGLHKSNPATSDWIDSQVTLDLDTAPFAYTCVTEDCAGGQAFVVSNIDFSNGRYQIENRKTTFVEKTAGVILYADYTKDDWVIDGKLTHSEASNQFENIGLNFSHVGSNNAKFAPTGFNGTINTGNGDLASIEVSGGLAVPYVYDKLEWSVPTASSSNITSRDELNQGRTLQANINGRVRDLDSKYTAVEANAKRFIELGLGDALRFDAIKFGARFSQETISNLDQLQGFGGIDTANVGSAYLSTENVLSAQQAPFFNGKIPGSFDHTNGWVTINNEQAIEILQTNIVTDRNDLVLPNGVTTIDPNLQRNRSGFWDRINNTGFASQANQNFEVEQDVSAFYVTTDFSGELPLDIAYTGNLGVRYVETANKFDAVNIAQDFLKDENGQAVLDAKGNEIATYAVEPFIIKDDYNVTLPMANISFELSDDVILRAAYYESMVRPNLVAQLPSPKVGQYTNRVEIDLPSATVRPYEADNYDLSLEWYNREGSAISVGFFQKNITNLFESDLNLYCPENNSDPIVSQFAGEIYFDEANGKCKQVAFTNIIDPTTGEVTDSEQREVNIDRLINTDGELKVEGFELSIQQKLDFLPYPWNGFGGVFNFTKLRQSGDENELPRVSPKSYNLIGYWENDGLSLRLAYNWRDEQKLAGANSFLGTGTRTRSERSRLDFSGSYKVSNKFSVNLQAFNLTDEVGTDYYGYDERAIHSLQYEGRVLKAGFSLKF